ncbi:MAG: cysteine synthase family protein [Ignavibacteria bacterium]|nr:cysteine synthase family protein [Ignavibacteria bacterium]
MIDVDSHLDIHSAAILARVGNTPLLKIENVTKPLISPKVQMYAKAEWYNPSGSVKDRPAVNMISEGARSGELTKDKIIIDATSGNTGIAYAMIGSVLGYRIELAVPANVGPERKHILRAYGAEVSYTDPLEGTDGAQQYVKMIVSKNPAKYFYPDQYNNPANWQAHYKTTALEIYEQTGRRITHFVAGLGTTGTFVGTSRRLKELKSDIKCISFQPDSPIHGLEGLKHLPTAIVPGIYDAKLADETLEVSTQDAYDMVRRLAREEGLLVGPSGGAAVVASLQVAQSINEGVVVTIFGDHGMKYLSDQFWEN